MRAAGSTTRAAGASRFVRRNPRCEMSGGKNIAGFVEDADFDGRATSHRSRLSRARWQRIRGHLMGRLSHSICFEKRDTESFFKVGHRLRSKCGAARSHKAQMLGAIGPLSRFTPCQQYLVNRGYR